MVAYTTSTAVGALLSTTFSSSTDPTAAEVNGVVVGVQSYIDIRTGRSWTMASTTEYFDTWSDRRQSWIGSPAPGNVQMKFFPRHYPIVSVQKVEENTSSLGSTPSWVTRASGYSGNYLVIPEEGSIWFHSWFYLSPYPGRQNIRITYTYGEAAIPGDIEYAARLLAAVQAIDMIKRASDQEGISSVSIGNASYNFGELEKQKIRYVETAEKMLDRRGYTARVISW